MKILLVDDQKQLIDAISFFLKENKIDYDYCYDGEEAYYKASNFVYDVIVLDIMIPHMNGYEVLKKLREENILTPILFLSAKGLLEDKIYGLNIGADDYLSKPFDINELIARIYALARRGKNISNNESKFGNLILDRKEHILKNDVDSIQLSNKEYEILETLIDKNTVVQKDFLIDKIWGYDDNSYYNKVEVYITFLRRKFRQLNANVVIKSLRDVGYRIEIVNESSK